jgi:hypothetical protein
MLMLFVRVRACVWVLCRKIVAIPIVEGLQWDTLEHVGYYGDTNSVGIFEWGFFYKEMTISQSDLVNKQHPTAPTR